MCSQQHYKTRPHLGGQRFQCSNTVLNGRHAWLYVSSVGRNRIVVVAVEAVGNLMEARQDRTVVLGAEYHHVYGLRIQLDPVHDFRKQRVTGQDITFPETVQEPFAVILDGIRPSAGVQDHSTPVQ